MPLVAETGDGHRHVSERRANQVGCAAPLIHPSFEYLSCKNAPYELR